MDWGKSILAEIQLGRIGIQPVLTGIEPGLAGIWTWFDWDFNWFELVCLENRTWFDWKIEPGLTGIWAWFDWDLNWFDWDFNKFAWEIEPGLTGIWAWFQTLFTRLQHLASMDFVYVSCPSCPLLTLICHWLAYKIIRTCDGKINVKSVGYFKRSLCWGCACQKSLLNRKRQPL